MPKFVFFKTNYPTCGTSRLVTTVPERPPDSEKEVSTKRRRLRKRGELLAVPRLSRDVSPLLLRLALLLAWPSSEHLAGERICRVL